MASGQLPFRGETSGVIFDGILNRTPISSVRLNPDLPVGLEEIINKALEKDRNLRYQHASEMRSDLSRLQRDTQVRPSPVAQSEEMPAAGSRAGATLPIKLAPHVGSRGTAKESKRAGDSSATAGRAASTTSPAACAVASRRIER